MEFLAADLSSQTAIRRLAQEFLERQDRLHLLINNAGALFALRRESVDGIEMTLALNHLAYFLLTNLLLDTIKRSAPARIVMSPRKNASGRLVLHNSSSARLLYLKTPKNWRGEFRASP